jgi:hypothetical protein
VKLPWRAMLVQVPTLLEAARRLYGITRPATGARMREAAFTDDADALQDTLRVLERRQEEQARLLANLTTEAEETAQALLRLRTQLRTALLAAVVALGLAVVAIALVVWQRLG